MGVASIKSQTADHDDVAAHTVPCSPRVAPVVRSCNFQGWL